MLTNLLGGDYLVSTRTVTKTYGSEGFYTAQFRNQVRPAGLKTGKQKIIKFSVLFKHFVGSGAAVTITARVNTREPGSPRIVTLPYVQLEKSATATQALALADPFGLGDDLSCRLSNTTESGLGVPLIGANVYQTFYFYFLTYYYS